MEDGAPASFAMGVDEIVDRCIEPGLRQRGARTVFLSNNPTKDPAMYAEKLTRLGIPTQSGEIVNTVVREPVA